MFQLTIGSATVFFAKSNQFGQAMESLPQGTRRVVFIDTPPTVVLYETIQTLLEERGIDVFVIDHHLVETPTSPTAQFFNATAQRIGDLIGHHAVFASRKQAPACSHLIELGDFSEPHTVIIADPDPDGLTAAMKAAGIAYRAIDEDAAVLDGDRADQTPERLSTVGYLLLRAMASVPPFLMAKPQEHEDAKQLVFRDYVALIESRGQDGEAHARLEKAAEAFEGRVREAEAAAAEAEVLMSGVAFVDVRGHRVFDIGTFERAVVKATKCVLIATLRSRGPVAECQGGMEYYIAAAPDAREDLDVSRLLRGQEFGPAAGAIQTPSGAIIVSARIWDAVVFPKLQSAFGDKPEAKRVADKRRLHEICAQA